MSSGLAGRRIAITRPEPGGAGLARQLAAAGAVPVLLPLIAVAPPTDPAPLRAAAARLDSYDWVVFTSANAVRRLHDVLQDAGPAQTVSARVAAVGSATADAVRTLLGWQVAAVPKRFAGDALVGAMTAVAPVQGRLVLWPRAELARDALPRDLARAGARLDHPVAYRIEPRPEAAQRLAALLQRGEIDVVVLTSPSAVDALAAAAPRASGALLCVIGSTTAQAARRHGMTVHIEPREHTIPALVDSLHAYLSRPSHGHG